MGGCRTLTSVPKPLILEFGAIPDEGLAVDRALVSRVVADGDERAFRQLYRRHTPAMEHMLRALGVRGEDDLDDLIQETWIRASRRLPDFEWRSALSSWLIGIAINVARRWFRRHRAKVVPLSAAADVALPGQHADSGVVDALIAQLPAKLQKVFLLRAVEGFTFEEIARRMHCTPEAARVRYLRARRALRARVELANETETT